MNKTTLLEKLLRVQVSLRVSKDQKNAFGNYSYRTAEGILAGVKPLLASEKLLISISDSIEQVGDRFYVKATVTVTDVASGLEHSTSAYARESLTKKGMDDSQVTGASSSYARKYALNGFFGIDDAKQDPDRGQDFMTKNFEKKFKECKTEEEATDLVKRVLAAPLDKVDEVVKAYAQDLLAKTYPTTKEEL